MSVAVQVIAESPIGNNEPLARVHVMDLIPLLSEPETEYVTVAPANDVFNALKLTGQTTVLMQKGRCVSAQMININNDKKSNPKEGKSKAVHDTYGVVVSNTLRPKMHVDVCEIPAVMKE